MLFYPGTNCQIHRVWKSRSRSKIKIDSKIKRCISCGGRKKVGVIIATYYNKILHNYCEDCYVLYRQQFKGMKKFGLKIVKSKKVREYENDNTRKESNLDTLYIDGILEK